MIENKLTLYHKDDNGIEVPFNDIVITEYNYSDDLMGKTQLSGSFIYQDTTLLDLFNKKQYTYFRDNKFYLINPPSLTKEYGTDNAMSKYNCVFTSEKDLLDNIPFTDLISTYDGTRVFTASRDFTFFGDIAEFGDRLYANLAQNTDIDYVINIKDVIIGSDGWLQALRTALPTDFVQFTFSYTSCFAALNLMYDTFIKYNLIWYLKNVDYSGVIKPTIYITDIVSNIGGFKSPKHIFEYGQNKGLQKISVESTNEAILTRIAGHGSTQNIPFDYPIIYNGNTKVQHPYQRGYLMPNVFINTLKQKYDSTRLGYDPILGFDPSIIITDYYDTVDGTINGKVYYYPNKTDLEFPLINKEAIEFDIKPTITESTFNGQRIDKVKSIPIPTNGFTEEYNDSTGEYTQPTFQMQLYPLGFDLYNQANEKEEMVINMTSGKCVGCAFKVNVDSDWLPSYDKNLMRCITSKSLGTVYDEVDWTPFFSELEYRNLMDLVVFPYHNGVNRVQDLLDLWNTKFAPLKSFYQDVAYATYTEDNHSLYYSKYLMYTTGSSSVKYCIEDEIQKIFDDIQHRIDNHLPTNPDNALKLTYLLSKNTETYSSMYMLYNDGFEIDGYYKRIADLKSNFLKKNHYPVLSGHQTIVSENSLLHPVPAYIINDLWVSSLRTSTTDYPNSTNASIILTLTKDQETFGTLLPTKSIIPATGDTFVITGISLPQTYVQAAQDKLDIALKDRLLADNGDKLNYSIPFDEKFIVENPTLRTNYLRCGNKISFKVNTDVIERTIKQIAIEVNDGNPLPKYTCSVSDEFKLKVYHPISTTDTADSHFRHLDNTVVALGNRITDVNTTANIRAGRFVAKKLYELDDALNVLGEQTAGLTVFGATGSIENISKSAKTTAEGKNKGWTIKPTPPYYIGDQWLVATGDAVAGVFLAGDTVYCKTTRLTGVFTNSDWSLSRYKGITEINTSIDDFSKTVIGEIPIGKTVFGERNSLEYTLNNVSLKINNKTPIDLNETPNGVRTTFTTTKVFFTGLGDVYINRSKQFKGIDYTEVSANTIEFNVAPKAEDIIVFEAMENTDDGKISFKDLVVEDLCATSWGSDGKITYVQATLINDIGGVFTNNTEITSFDELQYLINLSAIQNSSFQSCSALSSITFPNSIKIIGSDAFANSNLNSIIIPNTIVSIEEAAFKNCINLESVIIKAIKPPTLGVDVFTDDTNLINVYVPSESVKEYQLAANWSTYASIISAII